MNVKSWVMHTYILSKTMPDETHERRWGLDEWFHKLDGISRGREEIVGEKGGMFFLWVSLPCSPDHALTGTGGIKLLMKSEDIWFCDGGGGGSCLSSGFFRRRGPSILWVSCSSILWVDYMRCLIYFSCLDLHCFAWNVAGPLRYSANGISIWIGMLETLPDLLEQVHTRMCTICFISDSSASFSNILLSVPLLLINELYSLSEYMSCGCLTSWVLIWG